MDNAARLTVLGSLNMDISVTVPALPGPGATVLGSAAVFAPGGKGANQAVAAARLGGAGLSVAMIGCTGDDDFGATLRAALRAEGVDDSAVRTVAGVPSGIAMITVDRAGENIITVSPGANGELSAADVSAIGGEASPAKSGATRRPSAGDTARAARSGPSLQRSVSDVLAISAEVPVPVISAALAAAAGHVLCVLNLAPAPPEAAELVAAGPDWLVVNESEAAAVLGRPVSGLADAAAAAADLVAAGARNAVVTAGAAGAAYCGPQAAGDDSDARRAGAADGSRGPEAAGDDSDARRAGAADGSRGPEAAGDDSDARRAGRAGGSHGSGATAGDGPREPAGVGHPVGEGNPVVLTVPGFKVTAADTVGAGDTFVGALAVALAAGLPPVDAVTAAAAAGAAAATQPGTQSGMPRPADVLAATGYRWPLP